MLPGVLSGDVAESLLARAGGNPFFLEELVRTLASNDTLVLREGSWYIDARPGFDAARKYRFGGRPAIAITLDLLA